MTASAIFLRFDVLTRLPLIGISKIKGKEGPRLRGEETEAASCHG